MQNIITGAILFLFASKRERNIKILGIEKSVPFLVILRLFKFKNNYVLWYN